MQFQQDYCLLRGPYAMSPALGLCQWVSNLARSHGVKVAFKPNPTSEELEFTIASRSPRDLFAFEKAVHSSLHPNYWYINTM